MSVIEQSNEWTDEIRTAHQNTDTPCASHARAILRLLVGTDRAPLKDTNTTMVDAGNAPQRSYDYMVYVTTPNTTEVMHDKGLDMLGDGEVTPTLNRRSFSPDGEPVLVLSVDTAQGEYGFHITFTDGDDA